MVTLRCRSATVGSLLIPPVPAIGGPRDRWRYGDRVTSNAPSEAAAWRPPAGRRDASRNYQRILDAARDVLGESGADASMEEIAARAGVGVGTVYRRFASKDALIDELLRLAMEEILTAADRALARTDGYGLREFLRAIGQSLADHARYANLFLARRGSNPGDAAMNRSRAAIEELTARAVSAGTIGPSSTVGDVMALIWALRGLVQANEEDPAPDWQRFLDVHLAGLAALHLTPGTLPSRRADRPPG
jgi:AcrR family transcriptional regulator